MITIENYQTRFPNNNLEYFDKLNEEEKKEYLELYQKYHKLVLKYLIRKFDLLNYDKSLINNENKFIKVRKEDMDLYQYLCSDYLSYFYLRNNFYIERLTDEELEYLKNVGTNENVNEFIIRTLKKVITEVPDRKVKFCFGGDSLEFFKPNGSILIGVRYDEFSNKIPNDENWLDTYTNTKGELEFLLGGFRYANRGLNDMPIEVVSYNEYSIVKINQKKTIGDENTPKENLNKNDIHNDKPESTEEKGNIIFY